LRLVDLREDVADQLLRDLLDVVPQEVADGLATGAQGADAGLEALLDGALQDLRQHALELSAATFRLGLALGFVFQGIRAPELVLVVAFAVHPAPVVPPLLPVKRAIRQRRWPGS